MDRIKHRIYPSIVSNVCGINNFYDISSNPTDKYRIEESWTGYEGKLAEAISSLCNGTLDGLTWARILVPFVTGLLVRGPDFNTRFTGRILSLGFEKEYVCKDNINNARVLEFQRLLTLVIAAKWTLVNVIGRGELITNDLGFTPYKHINYGELGIAIPLNRLSLITLSFDKNRLVAYAKDNIWYPKINFAQMTEVDQYDFNLAIVKNCNRFVVGAEKQQLESYSTIDDKKEDGSLLIDCLIRHDISERAYEFTWHRLVSVLSKPPDSPTSWNFEIDFDLLAQEWCPQLILPTNLIECPSTLKRVDDKIFIDFYDPKIYYELSEIIFLNQCGEYNKALEKINGVILQNLSEELKCRILVEKAEALIGINAYDDAFYNLNVALDLDPRNENVITCLGKVNFLKGDFDKAIKELSISLTINEKSRGALFYRSGASISCGALRDAIEDLTKLIDLLHNDDKKSEILVTRGGIYFKLEEYDKALKDLFMALPMIKNNNDKSECYFFIALSLKCFKNNSKIITTLTQAIELNPNNYKALLFRAHIFAESGLLNEAKGDFSNSIDHADEVDLFDDNYLLLGIINTELNCFDEAEFCFTEAMKTSIEKEKVFYHEGLLYIREGKFELATKDFTMLLPSEAYRDLSLIHLGIIRNLEGDINSSLDFLVDTCDGKLSDEDRCIKLRYIALNYAMLGNKDKAIEFSNLVNILEPTSFFTTFNNGRIWFYLLDYETSLNYYELSSKIANFHDFAVPYIALDLIAIGKNEKGRKLFDGWLGKKPLRIELISVKHDIQFMISKHILETEFLKLLQLLDEICSVSP